MKNFKGQMGDKIDRHVRNCLYFMKTVTGNFQMKTPFLHFIHKNIVFQHNKLNIRHQAMAKRIVYLQIFQTKEENCYRHDYKSHPAAGTGTNGGHKRGQNCP